MNKEHTQILKIEGKEDKTFTFDKNRLTYADLDRLTPLVLLEEQIGEMTIVDGKNSASMLMSDFARKEREGWLQCTAIVWGIHKDEIKTYPAFFIANFVRIAQEEDCLEIGQKKNRLKVAIENSKK